MVHKKHRSKSSHHVINTNLFHRIATALEILINPAIKPRQSPFKLDQDVFIVDSSNSIDLTSEIRQIFSGQVNLGLKIRCFHLTKLNPLRNDPVLGVNREPVTLVLDPAQNFKD